jgi:2-iminobutanoate/2-iminopropanoate deaminase
MWVKTLLILGLLAALPGLASEAGRTYIVGDRSAARATLPFSEGVMVGDTLYVAGHLGLDPATGQAPANAEVEARIVMDAVKKTVEQAGLHMNDLVTVTVFCTDLGLYDSFNGVYRTYFQGQYPARAFIGAATLLRGGHYEVLGVAIRSSQKKN